MTEKAGQQESRGFESPIDSAGGKRVRRSRIRFARRYRASRLLTPEF
ncbi:hypothetical protein [Nostoc sp.]